MSASHPPRSRPGVHRLQKSLQHQRHGKDWSAGAGRSQRGEQAPCRLPAGMFPFPPALGCTPGTCLGQFHGVQEAALSFPMTWPQPGQSRQRLRPPGSRASMSILWPQKQMEQLFCRLWSLAKVPEANSWAVVASAGAKPAAPGRGPVARPTFTALQTKS